MDMHAQHGDSERAGKRAIVIAASTGGLQAIHNLLGKLSGVRATVPIFIVLHMPDGFADVVATQLQRKTQMPISPSHHGAMVEPGHIYLAAGNAHLKIANPGHRVMTLHDDSAPVNHCRPSADVLFESASDTYGPGLVAIVLSGMGVDGLRGCQAVAAAGGQILVQDQESSAVWGMPGAVVRSGIACQISPPEEIAQRLTPMFRRGEFIR